MPNELTTSRAFHAFAQKKLKSKTFDITSEAHGFEIVGRHDEHHYEYRIGKDNVAVWPDITVLDRPNLKSFKFTTINCHRLLKGVTAINTVGNRTTIYGSRADEKVFVDFRTSGKKLDRVVNFHDNNYTDGDSITILVNDPKKVKTYVTMKGKDMYTAVHDLVSDSVVNIKMMPHLKSNEKIKVFSKTANYEIMGEAGFSKAYLAAK